MAFPAQATSDWVVGNYRILHRIASGGMGVVYKAFDTSLERTVALKFLSPNRTTDRAERDRLLREARAASALDHENIAAIHSVGETSDGQLFIDMGYYEGEDLATRMRRTPQLSIGESLDIASQIARGLAHAHAHDVVHRDIKPSNIILTHDGVAKVVDFGLAQYASPDDPTLSFNFAGTLAYMAPERLRGKIVDCRSDIWSLGVLLYELLARKQPFRGDGTATLLNAILNSEPEPVPELPPALQGILNRTLEKDPARRYQSCEELLRDLEGVRAGDDALTAGLRPLQAPTHQRFFEKPLVRGLAAIALVLVIAMFRPLKVNDYAPRPPGAAVPAPNELYQQGVDFLDRYDKPENLNAAIQKFEQTTKADPNFALAYAALGEAYVDKYRQEQNPDWLRRAEDYTQNAARLNDQLAEVHVTMGRIHDLSGKHDLGQQEIMRALKLDPLNVKGFLALGDAYASVSRNGEAEHAYQRAIAIRPTNWDAYQRRGSYYFRSKQFESAANDYRRVIQLTPDNARAHSNLSAALLNLGDTTGAEREMKEALHLAPTYTAYYNLAYLYYTQKRYAEAAAMAELASELNTDDYNVWQMLGLSYEWTGQSEKANAAYRQELQSLLKAGSLNAEDAIAQAELGLLYSKLQRRQDALTHLQAALALEPKNPRVQAMVGEAYENFGDRRLALSYVGSAIQNGWDIEELYQNPDLKSFAADPKVQSRLQQIIHKGPTHSKQKSEAK